MLDIPALVLLLAFASVTALVFAIGHFVTEQASISRRLAARAGSQSVAETSRSGAVSSVFRSFVSSKVDAKRFGIEGSLRSKLRRDLMRAGFFSEDAIPIYIAARLGLVLVLPVAAFLFFESVSSSDNFFVRLGVVALGAFLGLVGVDAYIARRQRQLQDENRIAFPELMDMLVVCLDAGLSLDAALLRVTPELGRRSRVLSKNLQLLGAETRAGRSMSEALGSFAERLNLDEVRALAILMRQSMELGTDVADALRVFSDEMRSKRMLRAEEIANKLPVKMVLPLGAFIFPVILMVVMVPIVIRLLFIFHANGQ